MPRTRRPQPIKPAAVEAPKEERPEWVDHTPGERASLSLEDENLITPVQYIELTRGEFIELKDHLASTRGYYEQPAAQDVPKTEAPSGDTPDWVNKTPDDNIYSLTMYEGGGSSEQEVNLTREEFVRLKRWVAALRGYSMGAPLDHLQYSRVTNSPEELKAKELDITQEEIQMVQDAYRVIDVLCLNLRRRLRLGAKVEPGKWVLDETGADTIESYEGRCVVFGGSCGLDIEESAEEATATAGV